MVASRIVPDRNDATPLYIQVANSIREIIHDGSLDVGGALPSERTLSELTGRLAGHHSQGAGAAGRRGAAAASARARAPSSRRASSNRPAG
jgi:DNA-binding transcriptional MocR family regulator